LGKKLGMLLRAELAFSPGHWFIVIVASGREQRSTTGKGKIAVHEEQAIRRTLRKVASVLALRSEPIEILSENKCGHTPGRGREGQSLREE
jgi:hypothetical protein